MLPPEDEGATASTTEPSSEAAAAGTEGESSPTDAAPAEAAAVPAEPGADFDAGDDDEDEVPDTSMDDDYGPPFEGRSFGGEFAWADTPSFTCKILRVKPGENVIVSTVSRKDMHAMLTGGRALLEVHSAGDSDQVEMLPAAPIRIEPGHDYRLVAITEVELFVVYAPETPT